MVEKPKQQNSKLNAFTLLEVMISLLILVCSTLAVFALSTFSAKVNRQSEARAAALNIARTKIDQILSVTQSNRHSVMNEPVDISTELRAQMPGSEVSAVYSLKPVAGSKNLQTLEVVVSWRNAASESSSGPMTTVSASKVVSASANMNGLVTDGWNPPDIDQLFYTPPPPPPPPTTTGSTTGSTTGTSSTTGSTSSGSTNGSNNGSTTGPPPPPPPPSGFTPGNGTKWK